jgi:uncharacterized protein
MVYFYLDLAETGRLFRLPLLFAKRGPSVLGFRRKDYLGDRKSDLAECVRREVQAKCGTRPEGPIRLLTQLSYFGTCFNPVSFYFCFDREGRRVEFMVAEVTNTPWRERHVYVVRFSGEGKQVFEVPKAFHVSPFMPMEILYRWTLTSPGDRLSIHMESLNASDRSPLFDATLSLHARPLDFRTLILTIFANPLMGMKAIPAIYFQAFKLFYKRLRFYSHPRGGDRYALTGTR